MSRFVATQAKRLKLKARIGLTGATNTGKTYTALRIAGGLLRSEGAVLEDGSPDWSKLVVIDTERKRSLFYADDDLFGSFQHIDFEPPYDPLSYIEAVKYAESLGAVVCIIDSLSHAWSGTGGVLEIVNEKTLNSRSKNTFTEGWGGKEGGTALQNKMIDAIMSSNMHIICTFRQKMDYVQEKDEVTGRTMITKLGVKPVQRDDLEYEFDITLKLNNDHTAEIIKNTVRFLSGNNTILPMITEDFGYALGQYLSNGADATEAQNQIKQNYLNQVKQMAKEQPQLIDYFKVKFPNTKLSDLDAEQLKDLVLEFRKMVQNNE